jgi:TatA/E family protein of Tat protein translocase
MFGSLGFTELILILFIVLIIFGAGKLPQLGEGSAKRSRDLRNPFMRRMRLRPRLRRKRRPSRPNRCRRRLFKPRRR